MKRITIAACLALCTWSMAAQAISLNIATSAVNSSLSDAEVEQAAKEAVANSDPNTPNLQHNFFIDVTVYGGGKDTVAPYMITANIVRTMNDKNQELACSANAYGSNTKDNLYKAVVKAIQQLIIHSKDPECRRYGRNK